MARSWLKARPENRRVHRISEAVAHIRGAFILDVHVEFANVYDSRKSMIAASSVAAVAGALFDTGTPHRAFAAKHSFRLSGVTVGTVGSPLIDSKRRSVLFLFHLVKASAPILVNRPFRLCSPQPFRSPAASADAASPRLGYGGDRSSRPHV